MSDIDPTLEFEKSDVIYKCHGTEADTILNLVPEDRKTFKYGEMVIRTTSTFAFLSKNRSCQDCERNGKFIRLVDLDTANKNHLTPFLFSGDDVPMTVDHIVPKSKGGTNRDINLQTLCKECNNDKDDEVRCDALHLLPASYVKTVLSCMFDVNRIDEMVELIRERKGNNHRHPTMFKIQTLADNFEVSSGRIEDVVEERNIKYRKIPKEKTK